MFSLGRRRHVVETVAFFHLPGLIWTLRAGRSCAWCVGLRRKVSAVGRDPAPCANARDVEPIRAAAIASVLRLVIFNSSFGNSRRALRPYLGRISERRICSLCPPQQHKAPGEQVLIAPRQSPTGPSFYAGFLLNHPDNQQRHSQRSCDDRGLHEAFLILGGLPSCPRPSSADCKAGTAKTRSIKRALASDEDHRSYLLASSQMFGMAGTSPSMTWKED